MVGQLRLVDLIVSYIDVIKKDKANIGKKERVMAVHKVKDFDTWLKIFDNSEGKPTTKKIGLPDRSQ